jgi:hypothetical protein
MVNEKEKENTYTETTKQSVKNEITTHMAYMSLTCLHPGYLDATQKNLIRRPTQRGTQSMPAIDAHHALQSRSRYDHLAVGSAAFRHPKSVHARVSQGAQLGHVRRSEV